MVKSLAISMEELHIEEGDVLGTEETWAGEYDIAEDEEERLLEEHEVQDEQEALGYEGENQNYASAAEEYETAELEEDVLDLGLNDDIIEFEEVEGKEPFQGQAKANLPSALSASSASSGPSGNNTTPKSDAGRNTQQVLPQKGRQQIKFSPQAHNGPTNPRMSSMNTRPGHQRMPFNNNNNSNNNRMNHPRQFMMARNGPLPQPTMDFNQMGPRLFHAHRLPMQFPGGGVRGQPLMHHGNRPHIPQQHNDPFMPPHFSDHRNSNNNASAAAAAAAAAAQRCFINPHYKGSVHAPVQGNHHQHHQQQQNRMMLVATNELGPCFVQPPVGMFRDRPLPNVMPNFRFPPPVQNVLPPPRINAPPAAQRFAYPVGNPLTPVRELFKKRSSTSPRRWERDEEKDNIQMRKAEFV